MKSDIKNRASVVNGVDNNRYGAVVMASDFNEQIRLGAIRWLHSIDLDQHSKTYGVADREYWAWKTKDFSDCTHQGGISGFLDASKLISTDTMFLTKVISAVIRGTAFLQRSNGSFDEAYPYESSFAGTGIVVFNLLYSYFRYQELFTYETTEILRDIVRSALVFLDVTPETHGVISNHLCTAILAKRLSNRFLSLDEAQEETTAFLQLQHSKEGWFPEYGGADPGYQTLLNHYLTASLFCGIFDTEIQSSLEKSISFIHSFCFPDGSFSGEIGSRGTSIFYPSGAWYCRDRSFYPSNMFKWFSELHSHYLGCVSPTSVDSGDFIAVFNSWSLAGMLSRTTGASLSDPTVNYFKGNLVHFHDANLIVHRSQSKHFALSLMNGAIRLVERNEAGKWRDKSITSFVCKRQSTQLGKASLSSVGKIELTLFSAPRKQRSNTPFTSIVIRISALMFFRFPKLQRILKKLLAHYVMQKHVKGTHSAVKITVDEHNGRIEIHVPENYSPRPYGFHSHMASANTFDERAISGN